jgi:hypothetical protein
MKSPKKTAICGSEAYVKNKSICKIQAVELSCFSTTRIIQYGILLVKTHVKRTEIFMG